MATKNPWEDIPVEVLIEFERKKKEQAEDNRPRLYLPLFEPALEEEKSDPDDEEEFKIEITLR